MTTISALKNIAKTQGLYGYSKLNKQELSKIITKQNSNLLPKINTIKDDIAIETRSRYAMLLFLEYLFPKMCTVISLSDPIKNAYGDNTEWEIILDDKYQVITISRNVINNIKKCLQRTHKPRLIAISVNIHTKNKGKHANLLNYDI